MKYQVSDSFKAQTSKGEMQLQRGQVITLPHDKAIKLLNEGRIKVFCYWLEDVIEDCTPPCWEMSAKVVIRECKHFRMFWDRRLKQLERENEQFKT